MNEDVEFRRLRLPRTRVLSVSVGRSAANLVRVRQFFHGGKLRKGLSQRVYGKRSGSDGIWGSRTAPKMGKLQ